MTEMLKLIPEISPNQQNWRAKVIVAEKMSPKQAKHGTSRYQNMVLMDLQGNKVHATLYDANIQAFADKLLLAKTYLISNAFVKDTKPEYKSSVGEVQWTISGKTKVEELDEDNMQFLFSTYTITPFDQLEGFMDSTADITILAVAIDMRPKRLIQTRYGSQTYVQDVLLIDRNFQTIILTMWDSYVDTECTILAENLNKKPVILATRLKVSFFNGLTLSSKSTSTFFIDAPFQQVATFKNWIESHAEQLNEIAHEMHHFTVSPTKLSPPSSKKITQIQNLKGRLLGRKFYWVKASAIVRAIKQTFWYMSCNHCKKGTHAEFGETFDCIYCKIDSSIAVPRANTNVQLEDTSGILTASAIGEPAELILKCTAEDLMKFTKEGNTTHHDKIVAAGDEERLFYLKATQLERNSTQYKYEVVFVIDAIPSIGETSTKDSEIPTKLLCIEDKDHSSDKDEIEALSAKRALFELSMEKQQQNITTETEQPLKTSTTEHARGKRKLD